MIIGDWHTNCDNEYTNRLETINKIVEEFGLMEAYELSKANIRKEILQYLQTHPDAADSLNGIVNWWLSSKCSAEDMKKVECVLEQLIKDGLVKKIALIDKTIIYKRCKKKLI